MLVTLAIFSVAMAALVGGLYGGVRGWRTLTAHQERAAEMRRALAQLRGDFGHLCTVSDDEPALLESSEDGNDVVILTTRGTRFRQRAGRGCVWRRVEYRLRVRDSGDASDLVRTEIPVIATPPEDASTETTLVTGVDRFSVSYVTREGVQDTWTTRTALPAGVRIDIRGEGLRPAPLSVAVPAGLLGTQP